MDVEQLAATYTEEAIDNIAITKLYKSLDCSDLNSNTVEMPVSNDDPKTTEQVLVQFDKFMVEWAPFITESSDSVNALVAEGEEPPMSVPDDVAISIAEYVYGKLEDNSGELVYHNSDINGLRELLETYREYVEREPHTLVVDDELLDEGVAVGIEEIEDVEIYESEYLDLGKEILVANDSLGYHATRTPADARGYFSAPFGEADVANREDPYIVQCYTRVGTVNINPECVVRCTPYNRKI